MHVICPIYHLKTKIVKQSSRPQYFFSLLSKRHRILFWLSYRCCRYSCCFFILDRYDLVGTVKTGRHAIVLLDVILEDKYTYRICFVMKNNRM